MSMRAYPLLLSSGRTKHGDPLIGGSLGMPEGFSVFISGMSPDVWMTLKSKTHTGLGESTYFAVYELLLPEGYQPASNGALVINGRWMGTGPAPIGMVNAQAWRLREAEETLGDLIMTDQQAMTAEWADYSFTLSGAPLVPGDRLLVILEAVVSCGEGGQIAAEISEAHLSLESDIVSDIATQLTDIHGHASSADTKLDTRPTATEINAALTAAHGAGSWQAGGGAASEIEVDHDYGGTDNLRYVDGASGVADGIIRAYLAADYDAGTYAKRGESSTGADGRWTSPMFLGAGAYVFIFSKPGELEETTRRITVE